jgi:fructokinase
VSDRQAKNSIGLGELLWDLLPGGKQLGGAPANFAYWSTALGRSGIVASRVGTDQLGSEALDRLAQAGVDASHVQMSSTHPTGTVRVNLSASGQPDFTIAAPVAWDFMEWTSDWRELAATANVVCFGSLAQRSSQSRSTIGRFIEAAPANALIVFDVNLRRSFHSAEVIDGSLRRAQIVKLNDDEMPVVMRLLGLGGGADEKSVRKLLSAYDLELVCVTRGSRGSLLVSSGESFEHPGFDVEVVDSVGSGDAFTAALVHHYLEGRSLREISEAANRLGSWVATRAGAMPEVDRYVLNGL